MNPQYATKYELNDRVQALIEKQLESLKELKPNFQQLKQVLMEGQQK